MYGHRNVCKGQPATHLLDIVQHRRKRVRHHRRGVRIVHHAGEDVDAGIAYGLAQLNALLHRRHEEIPAACLPQGQSHSLGTEAVAIGLDDRPSMERTVGNKAVVGA